MGALDGKVAVVTGATGGLGPAVVAELLRAGAVVFAPHRRAGELENLREQLALPEAGLAGAVVDLTDEQGVKEAYAAAARTLGGIDVLVNIAGGFAGGRPVHESSWDLWQQQLDLNLKTAVLSCQAAVPHMLARGGGAIVNFGSRTATQPGKNLAAYAASKRAVIQLTEALAAELRDSNITANVVLPSTIDTPANRKSTPNADFSRWPKPEQVARVVLFLVGPDARIISGASVPVYGRA
ncbi:MAG TPA: SDR family NAD(P)-dependent oxidoreductase [Roseiflexaceae bacterium]|nr:SDR family NAD(P)-dependent oxidoreductase [Roseiflexaceae bacterium]